MTELIEEYLKYVHKKENKYLAPNYVKEKKEQFIHIDEKLNAIYSNWP